MIPAFTEDGCLPPGIHLAMWFEFALRYGTNDHRKRLLQGMRGALQNLKQAGCPGVFIDGSFVTSKAYPNDYDGCWDATGVDPTLLDPVLLDFTNERAAQKAKYGGELFVAQGVERASGRTWVEFFQFDQDDNPKGIVAIDLRSLP